MDWISAIFEHLRKLWPFEKVGPWERAIRVRYRPADWVFVWNVDWIEVRIGGLTLAYPVPRVLERRDPMTVTEVLGPGMHLCLWWMDEIHSESVVAKNYELPIQSITTKDDKSVTFGVNVTLEIEDVEKNLTQVHDFVDSMNGTARIHLAQRTREMTWQELLDSQKELERSLRGTLTTRLKEWGARVTDVGFTDLAHTRSYRWFNDPPHRF